MKILARSLMFAAILMTAACGSAGGDSPVAQAPAAQMVMAKSATVMDAGTTVTTGTSVDVASVTPIADNFDTQSGIALATWTTPSMGTDPVGAFRFICGAGQVAYDDPIVYPGQAGKSHLHQFYGNLATNADSTYASLRTTGDSTCSAPGAPVNRSGYWMPAMLDGAGNVVRPDYVAIYYKRLPSSDPKCTATNLHAQGTCTGIPTGLRFITGFNMDTGTQDAHPFFYCQDSGDGTVKAASSALHDNMTQVIPDCAIGARLTLNISSPDCWDGQHLDTPDHRSHMAFGSYVWDGTTSYYKCPDDHPYVLPQLAIIAFYTVDANFMANKWHLASDEMVPGAPPGTTFHADYFEAWSPTVRQTWLDNCINHHLNCAGGDLGNGTVIKGQTVPTANPRYIALSSIPNAPSSSTTTTTTTTTSTATSVPVVTSPVVMPPTTGTITTGTGTTTTGTGTTTTGTGTTTTGGGAKTCTGKGARKCSA